jgi:hypothetical protein|tara:strand:- start:417 stop:596 length:180 start_codon:yes stop_codon:yes gene_type:complete
MNEPMDVYDFEMDSFVAIKAPRGTDEETLVELALEQFAKIIRDGHAAIMCFAINEEEDV